MFKSSYIIQKTRSYPLTARLEDFEEFFAYWRIFCLFSKRRNLQTILRGRNPLHFPKRWQRSISMLPSIFKLLRTFCTFRSQSSHSISFFGTSSLEDSSTYSRYESRLTHFSLILTIELFNMKQGTVEKIMRSSFYMEATAKTRIQGIENKTFVVKYLIKLY